jgi:hypothetical protein
MDTPRVGAAVLLRHTSLANVRFPNEHGTSMISMPFTPKA